MQILRQTLQKQLLKMNEKYLFSYGIIADIQYADLPNGQNHIGNRTRKTLKDLQQAVQSWKNREQRIQFIMQMGDIIDGFNKQHNNSKGALKDVLNGIWFLIRIQQNRLLKTSYNRQELKQLLNIEKGYYSFMPFEGFKFIVLDSYDESLICPGTGTIQQHKEYLSQFNENIKNNGDNWTLGLEGETKRYVPFNGAIGKAQIEWLKQEIQCNEKIYIFSHLPIHPESSQFLCVHWNFDVILDIVQTSNNIQACFSGHDHKGGFFRDEFNINYVTMASPLEQNDNSYGSIDVYQNKMVLKGYGMIQDRILEFRN